MRVAIAEQGPILGDEVSPFIYQFAAVNITGRQERVSTGKLNTAGNNDMGLSDALACELGDQESGRNYEHRLVDAP